MTSASFCLWKSIKTNSIVQRNIFIVVSMSIWGFIAFFIIFFILLCILSACYYCARKCCKQKVIRVAPVGGVAYIKTEVRKCSVPYMFHFFFLLP